MNGVLVDELIAALASLVEDAVLSLEDVCVGYQKVQRTGLSKEQLDTVFEVFRNLLNGGRDISGVEIRCRDTSIYDWEEFLPSPGEITILHRSRTRTSYITIRQQSVHAQGGSPYGTQ